ncbi:hypothetical protein RKD55_002119 [Rossellomorea marisflavi]
MSEENWREGAAADPHFLASESPAFIGEAVKHLALDSEGSRFSGKSLSTWAFSGVYGYANANGTRHIGETIISSMWQNRDILVYCFAWITIRGELLQIDMLLPTSRPDRPKRWNFK